MSSKSTCWRSVTTFERNGGDSIAVRDTIEASDAADAAKRACFRALRSAPRTFESVVIVLDKVTS